MYSRHGAPPNRLLENEIILCPIKYNVSQIEGSWLKGLFSVLDFKDKIIFKQVKICHFRFVWGNRLAFMKIMEGNQGVRVPVLPTARYGHFSVYVYVGGAIGQVCIILSKKTFFTLLHAKSCENPGNVKSVKLGFEAAYREKEHKHTKEQSLPCR